MAARRRPTAALPLHRQTKALVHSRRTGTRSARACVRAHSMVCGNAGNVKELYNMFPKERFKEIKGVDDPFMTEKYVIRVYCLAPLYAFRHWDERGLYAAFQRWLREHPA